MTASKSDPDRALFADELRAMRKHRGWTRDELGARINFSGSTIGNIESGLRAPTRDQALLLDEAFETPGTFQRLEGRLRGVPFSSGFRPFHPFEADARTLRTFEHTIVPGLFQTRDYARVMMEGYPDTTELEVRDRVEGRMARQAILTREDPPPPPRVWAVLDQQVLFRDIGGPAVMFAQMEHLAELARRPRINIQVIPADRPHPGLLGAFVLAEMSEPPAILYLENALDGQTVEDPGVADAMSLMFDALRMEALTGSASLNLIEEAAQRWKEQTLP
ncbi:helix-turn-helix transcriptional regulator [Trebonia sp.]|uniref:helix-turn-helix domain-containing protein n=1 Tax=Trebonia sp. TaxID=2767075 RepID=UPI002631BD04|nr:helix-turn-helix transcriptional regulator [Trebonia sp.]